MIDHCTAERAAPALANGADEDSLHDHARSGSQAVSAEQQGPQGFGHGPKPATARQLEALRVIGVSIRERGYPPTQREIGDALGIRSLNATNDLLVALIRKDLLSRGPTWQAKSRTCTPTPRGWCALGLEPPPPARARTGARGPRVEVNLGWRCTVCNAHTFDATKPCPICEMKKRECAA